MTLDDFLQAIIADPLNAGPTWLVLADWLEERADLRFELVRLMYQPDYRRDLLPAQRDARVRKLLASGVQPVVPTIENSIGMRFALIRAGKFLMGSPEGEGRPDEHPQHTVEISRPFWLGAVPVTQEQYQRVIGENPSYFRHSGGGKRKVKSIDTKRFPVEFVSWEEAIAFCERVSKLPEEKEAGRVYRLPSEAQWEYSCRGGATSYSLFSFGDTLSSTQVNCAGNYPQGEAAIGPNLARPSPVGTYPANPFGLCDMHGNVWEWTQDWFGKNYYRNSPEKNPVGPKKGVLRVMRGGSWGNDENYSRSAFRGWSAPDERFNIYGFRVCFLLDFGAE